MHGKEWSNYEKDVLFPSWENIFNELGKRNEAQANSECYYYTDQDLSNVFISFMEHIDNVEIKKKIIMNMANHLKANYKNYEGK